jgi:hypothetical protein
LFFTDAQAEFICNSCFGVELDPCIPLDIDDYPWERNATTLENYTEPHPLEIMLPPDVTNAYFVARPKSKWDNMIQATRYLDVYSNRNLSYDSDALEAIVGALNTLAHAEDPVYHVWGMPVCPLGDQSNPVDCTPDSKGRLRGCHAVAVGLFWYHESAARRRQNLPSWSSLGWEGPISWPHHTNDEYKRGEESRHYINLKERFAYFSTDMASAAARSGYATLKGVSFLGDSTHKAIEIYAMTASLRLATSDDLSGTDKPIGGAELINAIVLPFDSNTEMLVQPQWDVIPTDMKPKQKLLGIIFHSSWSSSQAVWRDKIQTMMIVKKKINGRYERVGICWLSEDCQSDHFPQFRYRSDRDRIERTSHYVINELSVLNRLSSRNREWRTGTPTGSSEPPSIDHISFWQWGKRICKLKTIRLE